jgi:hypothetical protein
MANLLRVSLFDDYLIAIELTSSKNLLIQENSVGQVEAPFLPWSTQLPPKN